MTWAVEGSTYHRTRSGSKTDDDEDERPSVDEDEDEDDEDDEEEDDDEDDVRGEDPRPPAPRWSSRFDVAIERRRERV